MNSRVRDDDALPAGSRALRNKVLWGLAVASFLAIFALGVPFLP